MQLTQDINEIEKIQEEEIIPIVKSEKNTVSWLFIQLVICIIIVGTVIILKEKFPELFQELQNQYSNVFEKTMLIENGEIRLVQQ